MALELRGRVIAEPIKNSGVGQNGPWARTTVVIEVDGEYPYKLAMDNQNKAEDFARVRVGDVLDVKCRVSSREYNGKWYTSVNCYSWTTVGTESAAEAAPAPTAAPNDAAPAPAPAAPAAEGGEGKSDDLPF